MIESIIRFVLSNLPSILFFVGILIPTLTTPRRAEDYLKWLLLCSVGIDGVWVGIFHIFLPQVAAGYISWQVSPFQAAVVTFASIFFIGAAVGHIREIITANNFSPGNGGLLLVITLVRPVLMLGWLWKIHVTRKASQQTLSALS